MSIKDSLYTWFLSKVLFSGVEIIDKPGFVITSFSEKGEETYLRDMFLSENLFVDIENKIVEKYSDEGKKVLYSVGKKFGFVYASLSNFMKFEGNKEEFEKFIYFLVRYITAIYAKEASYKMDLEKKRFEIKLVDYVVSSKKGKGLIMGAGGISGIWANIIYDKDVEGVLETNEETMTVISAPSKQLLNENISFFSEGNLEEIKFSQMYKKMNLIRSTKRATRSLNSLIKAGMVKFQRGLVNYKTIRYFHCESHILFFLEKEISKFVDGKQILFKICFDYGKKLQNIYGGKDYSKFINDYFSALGWGDVVVINKEGKISVAIEYYPWTKFYEEDEFTVIRGILSGFISACLEKEIKLNSFKITVKDYLVVNLYC